MLSIVYDIYDKFTISPRFILLAKIHIVDVSVQTEYLNILNIISCRNRLKPTSYENSEAVPNPIYLQDKICNRYCEGSHKYFWTQNDRFRAKNSTNFLTVYFLTNVGEIQIL